MKGPPTSFWGKLDRGLDAPDGPVLEWHPLEAHCADVAACTEALLRHTILRVRLAKLAGRVDLDDVDIARLSALAALHDIGKYNLGFQRKGDAELRNTAGHVAEVLWLFGSSYKETSLLLDALPTSDLESWCDHNDALRLLVASIGHHGRPMRCDEGVPDPSLWRATAERDPFKGIASLAGAVRRWFPDAFAPTSSKLPVAAAFQHAFAGLIMLADWLGSDRAVFTYSDGLHDRMPFAAVAAKNAVLEMGLEVAPARRSLGAARPGFERVSAFLPREAQVRTMSLPRQAEGGLTVLESETGSGKTEAALGRFLHLFHEGLVDGMMFALPTRTAATQIHGRVREAMERAFPDPESRPGVVLAVPGYLQVDAVRGQRLPGFKVLWNDDVTARFRYRGWAAENPKRYLAGTVVVGTIDQVLLSSLRVGHAHLRATALLRHLLVVDEVHASDAYMNRILEEVLRFHIGAGGHAFLMSATLGSHVRKRLESAALGLGRPVPGTLAEGLATPYPVLHHGARGATPGVIAIGTPGLPKTIQIDHECIADEPAKVARRALDAARAGARVLVVRNTVQDATKTQEALEKLATGEDEPLLFCVGSVRTLHHARFTKEDRHSLDREIEARFGKSAPASGGVVTVATQTVQQSLDLDADILLTDLAPMDVLLQRLGRVHRHAERNPYRPHAFSTPRAIVLTSEDPLEASLRANGDARGLHGAGTVYADVLILEATRLRLNADSCIVIPEQNRELVEVTTHPAALDALARSLGPAWEKHRNAVLGVERADVRLGSLNLVNREALLGEYSFRDGGLDERISTRLGEGDRRAIFDVSPLGPFGACVRELTIPGWLARDLPASPDLRPTDVQARTGQVSFSFGPKRFIYDRLGLRVAQLEQEADENDKADA